MLTGWRYRVASVSGVVVATMLAVLVANHPLSQALFTTYVPLFWRLDPVVLEGSDRWLALALPAAVLAGSLVPLYKPRPRRIIDVVALAQRRVVVATCVLATLGYFNYTYRLPRATLVMTAGILVVALPAWFVAIRHRPTTDVERAVVVGDHPGAMREILAATELPVIGYVAPSSLIAHAQSEESPVTIADGGVVETADDETGHAGTEGEETLEQLECLGGLSRLDEVLVEHDVDAALLAFHGPDRAEFFGTLDACYEHGVTAKVHREHADSVLTREFDGGDILDVDLRPWDTMDHMAKRAFDLAFGIAGFLAALPVMVCIAAAITLEDGGPVLYSQERTATFGDTFTVYKFRTMVQDVEDAEPIDDEENPYITDVGRVLRRTHLDELPQLWSILVGDMSVVGPRAAWVNEEIEIEDRAADWRKRWFVKPGLTGLAQINGASSTDPEAKLRYDIEYIRRQSLRFDIGIVARQVGIVVSDLVGLLLRAAQRD